MKEIASGVWPVMTTPFAADNKVDHDVVLRIIQWYERMNAIGIPAACQFSKMFFLDKEERLELVRFVIHNIPKHMGVIASGHAAEKMEDQVREAQTIIDTGAEPYVFISNQSAKEGESEDIAKKNIEYLLDHIEAGSFGIYEYPAPYKRLLSPELSRWRAQTGEFAFLKDICCDLKQLKIKCEVVKGTVLKIFNANAATLLESLKMGCAGYSGVMASFHKDLYAWMCGNYHKEPERVKGLMDFLRAASMVKCQVYPVSCKYHTQLEGVDMSLVIRSKDAFLLTESKRMGTEQFHVIIQVYRNRFLGV